MANDKFKNALEGKAQNTPPIWFMRQAGRYHKHYQGLKQKHTFVELCKEPELAAETAMGPIEDFDFDVSILFSDLLFPLEALGLGLTYDPGPILGRHLDSHIIKDLKPKAEALAELEFQKLAVKATRERLPKEKSLIGFVGGPWTLFTYACEGAHKGSLQKAKSELALFNEFCNEHLVPLLIDNIQLQLDGGAEVIMVFDTAAGELSPHVYESVVYPQLKKMSAAFPKQLAYYSKGTQSTHLATTAWQDENWLGTGVDHRWDLPELLKNRRSPGFLQGNFDQALLFSETSDFKRHVQDYLKPFLDLSPEERKGWVCGLGHGVLPKTPEDHVRLFIDTVREQFA